MNNFKQEDYDMLLKMIETINVEGRATFPTNPKDKSPLVDTFKGLKPDPFGVDEDTYKSGQYAILLEPTDFVIDIDPRNFPDDRNPWKEFKKDYGLENIDRDTFVVKTGGGGYHIYLTKPGNINLRKGMREYPGIDFRAGAVNKALYMIGPGSSHETGNKYKVMRGRFNNRKPAPKKLLNLLEVNRTSDLKIEDIDLSESVQNIARFREYLEERALPAVEGQNGDLQTFKVACRGRDFKLTPEKTFELMSEYYNPKCKPPWHPNELQEKVKNAYKYNDEPAGKNSPDMIFNDITPEERPDFRENYDINDDWDTDSNGNPKKTLRNLVHYLRTWVEIHQSIRYNVFAGAIEVVGKLPWHVRRGHAKYWTDDDTIHLKHYTAQRTKGLDYGVKTIDEAILIVASDIVYHPVRDYLAHLEWDKTPRLSKWLYSYCGAPDSPYAEIIGRKTLIAAVARIFQPGVKFDHTLVLEGQQGIGKSTVVKILGGEWFGDIFLDPKSKDSVDAIRGKWFVELSELDDPRYKRSLPALKAFISRATDRVRLPYARSSKDFPRQCVFIGTINPDGVGYLSDTTGNRRFWPVFCREIFMDALKRDRDQLFAEAVEMFKQGEPLHITSKSILKEAEVEVSQRVEEDPWLEVIGEWDASAAEEDIDRVTIKYIYECQLGGTIKNITRREQVRIGKILRALGWEKKRDSKGYYYEKNRFGPSF